jgi:hypothetical protein
MTECERAIEHIVVQPTSRSVGDSRDSGSQRNGAAATLLSPAISRKCGEETPMGMATYAIIEQGSSWGVLHDGEVEGTFATKESAFEAAVAAASLAIRQGHEVHVSAPGSLAGNGTALGGPSN